MHFILNRTTNPFITSDRAIFVDSWTPQEAQRVFEPLRILDSEVGGAMERVTVLPISPQVAIISSAFVQRGYANIPYVECWSDESIFSLNLRACYSADRIIISDQDKPFGQSGQRAEPLVCKLTKLVHTSLRTLMTDGSPLLPGADSRMLLSTKGHADSIRRYSKVLTGNEQSGRWCFLSCRYVCHGSGQEMYESELSSSIIGSRLNLLCA